MPPSGSPRTTPSGWIRRSGSPSGELTEAHALWERTRALDSPWERPQTAYRFGLDLRAGWEGTSGRLFLARAGGSLVGTAEIFTSAWDNHDLALVEFWIDPQHRRQGHGAALLPHLVSLAQRAGRTLITVDAWDTPAAQAYARATGWPLKYTEAVRRLHPQRFSRAHWDDLYAEAAARSGAYELLRSTGESPPELLAALGRVTEAINDAPMEEMEWARDHYPAERIRQYEQAVLAADQRLYRVIARHRASGELAAHTAVAVNAADPNVAEQHETAVLSEHRGHRLGLLVKAEMLRWLNGAEPDIRTIDTGNAGSNRHMVAINERLGFELLAYRLTFQRRLPAAV